MRDAAVEREMYQRAVELIERRYPTGWGRYANHRECHLGPDWLLVYRIDEERDVVTATRLGSHGELFGP